MDLRIDGFKLGRDMRRHTLDILGRLDCQLLQPRQQGAGSLAKFFQGVGSVKLHGGLATLQAGCEDWQSQIVLTPTAKGMGRHNADCLGFVPLRQLGKRSLDLIGRRLVAREGVVPNPLAFLQYRSGTGANTLSVQSGIARIDATVDACGFADGFDLAPVQNRNPKNW